MIRASEAQELAATMREMIAADPELIEALAIVAGTAEALAADERAESEWQDAQEYGGNRTPERE